MICRCPLEIPQIKAIHVVIILYSRFLPIDITEWKWIFVDAWNFHGIFEGKFIYNGRLAL
jgi:hypothetical protein